MIISRREFLKVSALAGLGSTFGSALPFTDSARTESDFSFGVVADLHYAHKDMRNNRYYRESLMKVQQCVEEFQSRELPLAIVLGDFVDSAPDRATELGYLQTIRQPFAQFLGERYLVLGNHDLMRLTKDEFLEHSGFEVPGSYYSFDLGAYHFVVLDANFRQHGEPYARGNFKWRDTFIPPAQIEWLRQDLQHAGDKKALVFVHQNLSNESNDYRVKNAGAVRKILEGSRNVLAVFQGHDHRGGYRKINNIHYLTLKALVDGSSLENNAYAIVSISADQRIRIQGFGKQESLNLL
jgi:alkaline phosphatase